MLDSFSFAVEVTLPICLIIGLGFFLKRIGWITEEFAETGSKLVFNLTLPCLLFVNIVTQELTDNFPFHLVVYATLATTAFFAIHHMLAYRIADRHARGAFVQGACRGNLAILGLAISINAFGQGILPMASMYLAFIVIFINVYSIVTLMVHEAEEPDVKKIALSVISNPLAIAIALAVAISLSPFDVPKLLVDTGSYFAKMTLPLALLCVGATIRLREFQVSKLLYLAITSKVIFIPVGVTLLGFIVGLRAEQLGLLYIMMGAPTAAAAYPMTRAIGGDYHLTAAIIAGTTVASMFTYTVGLFFLHYLGWI
jgi:malonate transporter